MSTPTPQAPDRGVGAFDPLAVNARDCLAGGGEMGARMRAFDWPANPLGPVESWPQSLRTSVSILLASGFPMLVVWGREYIQLYNDAYRPVLGATKHPAALGQRAPECWPEIWDDVLGPMFTHVVSGGEPIWSEDLAFHLDRNGYLEETFFTFSYSAIRDESGRPGGILVTCVETTERVLGERRLRTLCELAAQASNSPSVDAGLTQAAETLGANPHDVPFALTYLLEPDGRRARLVGREGLAAAHPAAPQLLARDEGATATAWPIGRVVRRGVPELVTGLTAGLGAIVAKPWPEPVDAAAVLPIAHAGQAVLGVLVAGISPRRAYDDRYRDFLGLVAGQIAATLTNARAYEAERARAEALAEIDRAKTAFFSNVSHEFRTPLTLILGPTEALLAERHGALTDDQRQTLEILRRNATRLQKLVNALLDYSRIEAGRAQASYVRTDVALFTREIASAFQSLVEQAGLRFDVSCAPIDAPVYVDRDMWEKVVLNLLSNAFKFTVEGAIGLELRRAGDAVELSVRDTGIGIPAPELPRVFERFHRVEGARGRAHEGSGIGLALTHELVRLHSGTITADSQPGRGSTFTVRIPTGRDHLPAERIGGAPVLASTSPGASPFVDEAARWLPGPVAASFVRPRESRRDPVQAPRMAHSGERRERILVVDDNRDMREYLTQLLGDWSVAATADGDAALASVRESPPDLVVTDVMMPGLDGFQLLTALRADPATRSIPVLMLSARAGEDARVSGLTAGADDYMTKPFAARELIARVRSLLAVSRARREAEAANLAKDNFLAMLGHELRNPLAPIVTALQLMTLRGDTAAARERTVIDRQVRHLARLVDDLLDVSRIAQGKIELRRQRVEIADIVASAIESASPLFDERQHAIDVHVLRAGLAVDCDVTRLTQAVTNVLTNAAKYTEPRGRITVTAERQGDRVELRVKDTGIGIAPELLPTVFDMFSQGRQALDRSRGGLGLGLTIVKSLVALHDGTVDVRSEGAGQGSEFVIRLPIARPAAVGPGASARGAIARAVPVASGRRVLVVDDNADAAQLIADALETIGHETRVAFDGPAALEAASTFCPEVALLDLGLPLMDGYELADRLGSLPGVAPPVLVALTGYGQATDVERSRAAGFNAHIVKPVDMQELMGLLDRLRPRASTGA